MSFKQSISCFLDQQKDFILYLPDTQLVAAMSENNFRSEKNDSSNAKIFSSV